MNNDAFLEANRQLWNQRTRVHVDSAFYNRRGFVAGETALTPIELGELGPVHGKSLLHLQCHFGMDTLDWARRGARVTGIDFSEEAIREAERLRDELELDARFYCCNVYDTDNVVNETFDIVFTSYGVIGWLPDLKPWARVIARLLRSGGQFYLAEFHPLVWMFDDDFTRIAYAYDNRGVIETDSEGTYTDRYADIRGKEYGWNHSLSDVIGVLLDEGLRLEFFHEHMYSPYPCFRHMTESGPGQWQILGLEDKLPLVYSLSFRKQ